MEKIQSPYKELLEKLLNELRRICGDNLISLALYGSVARGDFHKDSDIDLLIICEKLPKEKFLRQKFFIEIEKAIPFEKLHEQNYYPIFSPILKTSEEAKFLSPLYLDMVDDAIILFDKDDFFRSILDRLKSQLKKLGAIKKTIGNKWYWDLKPDYKFGDDITIE